MDLINPNCTDTDIIPDVLNANADYLTETSLLSIMQALRASIAGQKFPFANNTVQIILSCSGWLAYTIAYVNGYHGY